MPAEVIYDPPGLTWITSKGTRGTQRLARNINPALAEELLTGLAGTIFPHGKIDADSVVRALIYEVNALVAMLNETGHRGSGSGLTRKRLAEVLLRVPYKRELIIRRLLRETDEQLGILAEDVRVLLDGRPYKAAPRADSRSQLLPYTEGEWQRLQDTCRVFIKRWQADRQDALRAAETGGDPVRHGFTTENVCWWLVRHGPTHAADFGRLAGLSPSGVLYHRPDLPELNRMLFPGASIVIAFQLLFGAYTGVVPDGIDGLGIADLDWAGDATILLDYFKGRTSAESTTLNRKAVRLLERWLELSAPARGFAPVEVRGDLWLRYRYHQGTWHVGKPSEVPKWVRERNLLGDDGNPLPVHRQRIRTTFHTLRERSAWVGSTRAVIDPNHSPRTEGDHYLGAPTPAQQEVIEDIITAAQADMVRRASPPMVLTSDEAAELARRFPELVASAALDDEAIKQLAGGQRDVFVAGCADYLNGPIKKGVPCPARPWVCLLCPLAVFAPRHAPNLLRLSAWFARQWQMNSAAEFMARFGAYAQRIDQILAVFRAHDPHLLQAAAAQVADTDDELPLLAEERTT